MASSSAPFCGPGGIDRRDHMETRTPQKILLGAQKCA